MTIGFTVISQEAAFPFDVVTVIVAVPGLILLTTPAEETVATFVSLDVHLNVVTALEGVMVGINVIESPSWIVSSLGSDMLDGRGGSTVTSQKADLPLEEMTIMVVFPSLIPSTTPEGDTLATFMLVDPHCSVVSALEGVKVGVKVIVSPS